jgi:hypothetical protein
MVAKSEQPDLLFEAHASAMDLALYDASSSPQNTGATPSSC